MEQNREAHFFERLKASQSLCLVAMSFALLSVAVVSYANGDQHPLQTVQQDAQPEFERDNAGDPCNFAEPSIDFYTYEQVRACYDRIDAREKDLTQFVDSGRAFIEMSSLRNVYDERFQWRAKFDELATFPVASSKDWELQRAIARTVITGFKNGHFKYDLPLCYSQIVHAFMPLEFGSTVVDGEQIVFVEDALYFPEAYRLETGIDTTPFIGKKVVSIDGIEPLEFIRQWGREALGWNPNDSVNFNQVVADGRFSLRFDNGRFVLPQNAHTFVFESRSGSHTTASLPFMFVSDRKIIEKLNEDPSRPGDVELSLRGPKKFDLPNNTEAFTQICLAERDPETLEFPDLTGTSPPAVASNFVPSQLEWERRRMLVMVSDDDHRMWVRKKLHRSFKKRRSTVQRDFFEVPDEELGELEPLYPPNDLIETYQLGEHGKDATVIKINGFGLPRFDPETRQGRTDLWFYSRPDSTIAAATAFACENSDRLIVDFRSSPGGVVTNISWLLHHLFPVERFYQGNILHITQLVDFQVPAANSLLFAGHAYDLAVDLAIAEFLKGQSFPFDPLTPHRLTLGQGTRFVPIPELFVTDPLQSEQVIKGLIPPAPLPFVTLLYDNSNPLDSYLDSMWYLALPIFVERNGVTEVLATPNTSLSSLAPYLFTLQFGEMRTLELFGELPNDPYFQPIQCPGKFRDETLVVLVNGINGSASYITPTSMLDKAVVVGQGGYVGEPLMLGSRRGGPITRLTSWIELYRLFDAYVNEPVALITSTGEEFVLTDPVTGDILNPNALLDRYYPDLGFEFNLIEPEIPDRAIDLVIEFFEGISFDEDLNLSLGLAGGVTNPNQEAEIRLDLWSNSLETDGFIYRKAIEAAEDTALQGLREAAPQAPGATRFAGFSIDLQGVLKSVWTLGQTPELSKRRFCASPRVVSALRPRRCDPGATRSRGASGEASTVGQSACSGARGVAAAAEALISIPGTQENADRYCDWRRHQPPLAALPR